MSFSQSVPNTAQRHAQARQTQAINRIVGVFVFAAFVGLPAACIGMVLYWLARKNKRRTAILAVGMLLGLSVVALNYRRILADVQDIRTLVALHMPALQAYARTYSGAAWANLASFRAALALLIGHLWLLGIPLAPLLALQLEGGRPRSVTEQRAERQRLAATHDQEQRRQAADTVKKAPDQVQGQAVIGIPIDGDLPWVTKAWVTYAAALLNRHAVIIGGTGTGKTEFIFRVASVARKVYGWKVIYIDAKGDMENMYRFRNVMQAAGVDRVPLFPDEPYNGWVGDATAVLNRVMAVEEYSEPYYRAVAKTVLTLATKTPSGPPRSSDELLRRLRLDTLVEAYDAERSTRADVLGSLTAENVNGVQRRYFGFFDALAGQLDGGWSFDDVDAAYLLLEGLALKEEARALGRYLLEDFAHYVSKRKPADQKILLIIDEFSALSAGGADAANLFERLRSFGAGIMVTSQTGEGLGEDAKKLIGAAAVTVAFQCADPEPIAARAGRTSEVQESVQIEHPAMPGRNPFTSQRAHTVGTSVQREQEGWMLHPDVIRRLDVGECCIVANGSYLRVRVAQSDTKNTAQPPQALRVKEARAARAVAPPARQQRAQGGIAENLPVGAGASPLAGQREISGEQRGDDAPDVNALDL